MIDDAIGNTFYEFINDWLHKIFFLLFFLAFLILVIYMPLSKLVRELVKTCSEQNQLTYLQKGVKV